MARLKKLLGRGYLPAQIPPCFTSDDLGRRANEVGIGLAAAKPGLPVAHPYREFAPSLERYSVGRSRHSRRPIAIPNPIAQYELCEVISREWRSIDRKLRRSRISKSYPLLSSVDDRSIKIATSQELYEERLRESATSQYVLVSDISQFFPSLYTHSVPWALHGKSEAKRRRRDRTLLGNRLDGAVQQTQNRQTLGVPIGPDSSHILAEILGVSIDELLQEEFGSRLRGYRHVDDFCLFWGTLAEAESGLAALESAVSSFELKLNSSKTRILTVQEYREDGWAAELQTFRFSKRPSRQRAQVHSYFETLFSTVNERSDENVVRYGMRRLGSVVISNANWDVLSAHLLKSANSYPSTLQDVSLLLYSYQQIGLVPDANELASWTHTLLARQLPLRNHNEVAWLLWLALIFEVPIELSAKEAAVLQDCGSVCLVLGCALTERGLLSPALTSADLEALRSPEELYADSWLAAYECAVQGWIDRAHVLGDPLFSVLAAEQVSFFKINRRPKPLFRPKRSGPVDWDRYDPVHQFQFSPRLSNYQAGDEDDDDWLEDEDDDDADDHDDDIAF